MSWLTSIDWVGLLSLINAVLTSAIVISAFALLVYITIYNLRSSVARSFSILLACVLFVYFVDLAVAGAAVETVLHWLRVQWLGIAFTPAAYLHFSDALLRTTNRHSRALSAAVRAAYALAGLTLLVAAFTDLLVWDGVQEVGAPHLRAGPLFPLFFFYFATAVIWSGINVILAWRRCLTSTSRRRMTYLALAFAAPAIGSFPYLLVTGWPQQLPGVIFWLLLILGNLAVGLMLLVMAYPVVFFGAFTPDRVVKHRFVRFLLRGPVQAAAVVVVIIAASRADGFLGLPALRLSLFGAVIVILLVQLGVELVKPFIDRLLYRRDRQEIAWLQEMSNRLLTSTDLRQFLENVLTALCDLLRTPTAFVAVIEGGQARLEVVCGSLESGPSLPPGEALDSLAAPSSSLTARGRFFIWDGYWLLPLRDRSGEGMLGVLGMVARASAPDLSPQEEAGLDILVRQVEAALEDRLVQQHLFSALGQMIPQIEEIQRRRALLRYEGTPALTSLNEPMEDAFQQWVRDALAHYWGGPKLTSSPLLKLQVVERAIEEHGSPVNALRAVLETAIERLRPEGDRSMTAAEWLLYNILELKFLKRYRVRDIAMRLAMSESDFYRKQRIAIEEVARTLAAMEQEERNARKSA